MFYCIYYQIPRHFNTDVFLAADSSLTETNSGKCIENSGNHHMYSMRPQHPLTCDISPIF